MNAAAESTGNNKSTPEKKPGSDHAAPPKPSDADAAAAAAAKKLHSDSHPAVPKPAAKADAPKPSDSGVVHNLYGWLSSAEKTAQDAVKIVTSNIKTEAKAVAATAAHAATVSENALAHFGSLTLYSGAEGAKHDKAPEPTTGKTATEPTKKAESTGTKPGPVEATAAPTPGATPGATAVGVVGVPGTPANPSDKGSADTSPAATTGSTDYLGNALGAIENVVVSAVQTAGAVVKQGIASVMSAETEQSLMDAASTYGSAALAAGGDALALPTLVGYAGAAYAGYKNIFESGHGTFKDTAETVDSFKGVTYESLAKADAQTTTARSTSDLEFAKAAAKELGMQWIVPGDGKPGGGAEISRVGNSTLAHGTTKDGVDVKVQSTAEKQEVSTGAITSSHTADGTTASTKDFKVDKNGKFTTLTDHDGTRRAIYDVTRKTWMIVDDRLHTTVTIDSNGVETKVDNVEARQAENMNGLKNALPKDVTVRYAVTRDGQMGAFTSDGTSYIFSDKTKLLTVEKDSYRLTLDVEHGIAKLYKKDPKTGAYVLTKPDASNTPNGWKIHGNSVEINGGKIKQVGHVLNVVGAEMDLKALRLKFATIKGTSELAAGNGETSLTTPGGETTKTNNAGKVVIETPGEAALVIDTKSPSLSEKKSDGSSVTIGADGAAKLVDGKSGQSAVIDARGNETVFDAKHQEIFSMNNQGDIHLYDGTNISHTGIVQNVSRGIDEPAYNGKTADQVVREAANEAASLSSYIGGSVDSSIASLEAILATLDGLGDIPGLAEQIGAAKGTIQAKIAQARDKESLNDQLTQAGKDTSTIEKAFALRGSGVSDGDIARQFIAPQTAQNAMLNK